MDILVPESRSRFRLRWSVLVSVAIFSMLFFLYVFEWKEQRSFPLFKPCEKEGDGICWCSVQKCQEVKTPSSVADPVIFHTENFELRLSRSDLVSKLKILEANNEGSVDDEEIRKGQQCPRKVRFFASKTTIESLTLENES